MFSYNYVQTYANMIESGRSNDVAWGNQLGYILLPFHLAMHDDPLAYVREAKMTVDRKKSSLEAIFTCKISEVFVKMFGLKVYFLPIYLYVFRKIELQELRNSLFNKLKLFSSYYPSL